MITKIKSLGIKYICPSHCTGDEAIGLFAKSFKEGYVQGGLGIDISFETGVPKASSLWVKYPRGTAEGYKHIETSEARGDSDALANTLSIGFILWL